MAASRSPMAAHVRARSLSTSAWAAATAFWAAKRCGCCSEFGAWNVNSKGVAAPVPKTTDGCSEPGARSWPVGGGGAPVRGTSGGIGAAGGVTTGDGDGDSTTDGDNVAAGGGDGTADGGNVIIGGGDGATAGAGAGS
eukprot:CAMPEP_0183371118 /NCGR_PEP_ID=MMETSP0164_2-20130417/104435_1 /TAXON_ID=221442 /ORGANISM="Coccolithus pelagicus ssp braarudi, Strain PLY182g" /LENGTH=137 /DNA_ID=CAMNT_0025547619 /DNA_START=436 /DNA_END=845 /DNA_ORIENTATION=+